MREPAFWWQAGTGGPLAPFGALYGVIAGLRMQARGRKASLPVICLGNLTVGGAGKTPAALAVAQLLHAAHERPFFLSRGYGGRLAGPVRVNPALHRASDIGDEPILLARLAPTIVARDRVAGAAFARSAGASVIIMDDGFQNPSLAKDLSFVLIDGRRGIGNGRVIPAGPLRAPLELQLERAQALIVVGAMNGATNIVERAERRRMPIFRGRLEPDAAVVKAIGQRKVLAFAGIADPDKFFVTLAAAGIQIARRVSFPDHHRFSAAEALNLLAQAQADHLMILTTEKDLARLTGEPELQKLAAHASALPVRLVVEEQDRLREVILSTLAHRRATVSAHRT
jgi:tetraacyldisaccharide 4'-kinase